MKAKGVIAVLVIAGLLIFVAVSVFGGSKEKATSIRTFDTKERSVPGQINYQGYLVDSSDSSAITGTLEMTFKIYDTETDGDSLWGETQNVEVSNGLFNVLLGTPAALFTGQDLWLETTVEEETLSPRKKLVSVPYAFKDDCWTSSGNDCYFDKSGYVGIGTTSPSSPLEISINTSWIYFPSLALTNENTNGYGSGLAFNVNPGGVYTPAALIGGTADGIGGKLDFRTYTGVFLSTRMTIDMNGNVGIGTTTPARKLHINDVMRLQPRASAPPDPQAGDMYIDSSDSNRLKVYDGNTWQACW